jgi:hypothetical protein
MDELQKSDLIFAHISQAEVQELFPKVNQGRDTYVDPKTQQFVEKIIELWFQTLGYDFWNNPYPDVEEWSCPKTGGIDLSYKEQEK